MIQAQAWYTDESRSHLRLVISYPDGHEQEAQAVSEGEARRLVFFYNRLYIADTMKHWLNQRKNVFKHFNDPREMTAQVLYDQVEHYSKTSLRHLCQLVCDKADNISVVAPREKSRYYKTYETLIIPILAFCREMRGDGE